MNPIDKARRTVAVADMLLAGYTSDAILNLVPNYPAQRVSVLRKHLGITPAKRGRKVGSISAKTAEIARFMAGTGHNGMTLAAIGKRFGVSRQRIDQIVHPVNHRSRERLKRSVKMGQIKKPQNCQGCKKRKPLDARHRDYTKPLDVLWLCKKCHGLTRRKPAVN